MSWIRLSYLTCCAVALASLASLKLGACIEDKTTVCATGLRCPSGMYCTDDGDQCTATLCGNGSIDPGEYCDDGNIKPNDGCSKNCVWSSDCGDGIVDRDLGEICDCGTQPQLTTDPDCNGMTNNHRVGYCNESCRPNCNDNVLDAFEDCEGDMFEATCLTRGFHRGVPECSTDCKLKIDDCDYIGWAEEDLNAGSLAGNLTHAWRAADGTIYAVGENDTRGVIFLYEDGNWRNLYTADGEATQLYGIWGAASDHIFAVGSQGHIVHYDGETWRPLPSPVPMALRSVWSTDYQSSIWAVGDDESVFLYDHATTAWSQDIRPKDLLDDIDDGSGNHFYGVWGSSSEEVYVVGNNGIILHYQDNTWVREAIGMVDTTLMTVWGTDDLVFAAGEQGTLLMRDESGWHFVNHNVKNDIAMIWGFHRDEVFAVGDGGAVLFFDGTIWTQMRTIDKNPDQVAVFSDDTGTIQTIEHNGRLRKYTDMAWLVSDPLPNKQHVRAIWTSAFGELYTAMSNGTILRLRDNHWSTVLAEPLSPSLHGIWGTPDGKLYAVGGASTILESDDGENWSIVALPEGIPSRSLRDIWGSPEGDLFVVGDADDDDTEATAVILSRSNGIWSLNEHEVTKSLRAVWGSSRNNVYAVGEGGRILRWNGNDWSLQLSYADAETLHDVWGSGPNDIFAVGDAGTILANNGNGWLDLSTPLSVVALRGVWSDSPQNVYIVGDDGTFLSYKYDMNITLASWSPIISQTTQRLLAVSGMFNPASNTQVLSIMGENAAFFQLAIHRAPDENESRLE